MTVSTIINRVAYTATASQTTFAYTFKIFTDEESTLEVYVDAVLKTLTTDYTVTGAGVGAGGNVVFNSGLTAGDEVVIVRVVALSQLVDYVANDPFPAETHEEALDRLTMLVQQLGEENDRAITLAVTSALSTITFPDPGAGQYVKWNSAGTALETGTFTGTGTTVSSFMVTLLDDTTAAAARTTLGAGTSSYSDALTTRGDVLYRDSSNVTNRLPVGGANTFLGGDATDAAYRAIASDDLPSGSVVQVANVQDGTLATGTTLIPYDDTTPQNTEGDEYMTLAITPKATANKLKIEVVFIGTNTSLGNFAVALFQDSTTDAIATGLKVIGSGGDSGNVSYTHYMAAGTTSATTFKVRAGLNVSGTTSFSGRQGSARYNGTIPSSITITEIKA